MKTNYNEAKVFRELKDCATMGLSKQYVFDRQAIKTIYNHIKKLEEENLLYEQMLKIKKNISNKEQKAQKYIAKHKKKRGK